MRDIFYHTQPKIEEVIMLLTHPSCLSIHLSPNKTTWDTQESWGGYHVFDSSVLSVCSSVISYSLSLNKTTWDTQQSWRGYHVFDPSLLSVCSSVISYSLLPNKTTWDTTKLRRVSCFWPFCLFFWLSQLFVT